MRRSTLISLGLALLLACVAVLATRAWLGAQRVAIQTEMTGGQQSSQTVVVAAKPLLFGNRIVASDLATMSWPAEILPVGAFTSVDAVVGTSEQDARYVISAMATGEPVLASRVSSPGQRAKLSTVIAPDMRAVSIRVNDVLGVAGFVLPGDRVDVLLTHLPQSQDDSGAYVDMLLQAVKVVAVDQSSDDQSDQPSLVRTVTVEVTPLEAQKLTLAGSIGTLSLALRNVGAAGSEAHERVTVDDLGLSAPPDSPPAEQPAPRPAAIDEPSSTVGIGVVRNGSRVEYQVTPWDAARP